MGQIPVSNMEISRKILRLQETNREKNHTKYPAYLDLFVYYRDHCESRRNEL